MPLVRIKILLAFYFADHLSKSPAQIQVHDGFQDTFERTSGAIFNAVQQGLSSKNVNTLQFVGHSLGAAIAVMDAVSMKPKLNASVQTSTVVFGLPRSGNQAWADFVDSTVSFDSVKQLEFES
jgi:hypothetical protein